MSVIERIEDLLKQHMGLHSATVGSGTVRQAVEKRMRDCLVGDTEAYLTLLLHSSTELNALIDTVVIPETWFYRDRYPFAAFSAWVQDEWLPSHPLTKLRALSVPCSSGEEPYTLAMCLAEIGLPAGAAQIDAVDISHDNIERARRGNYGSNSFRGNELDFRERFFMARNQRYQLCEEIRHRVHFARANILDESFLEERQPYHVIFCRNLLIYFDRPTQNAAIERLEKLLVEDGVLFLGHSETNLLLEKNFKPLGYSRCFAFKRATPRHSQQPAPAHRKQGLVTALRQRRGPLSESAVAAPKAPRVARVQDNEQLLADAFQLADQGHLDEAALHCETLLERHSHQAEVHYLLGLIRESTGNRGDAEKHLRKAIYLNPDHHEALAHLGEICLQHGDATSAKRLQQRALRARDRINAQEGGK